MTRLILPALALLLAGCLNWRGPHHPATDAERAAIAGAVDAWTAAGRPAPFGSSCELGLERVVVVVVSDERTPCRAPWSDGVADGCARAVQPSVFEDRVMAIYVSERLDAGTRLRTIVHEALHIIRGCVIFGYREALDPRHLEARWWGVDDSERDARAPYPADNFHQDRELWGPIQRDAKARLPAWARDRP